MKLRSSGLEWRKVEEEIVALDIDSSRYMSANRAGAALWPLLAEGTDIDELAQELESRYGLDRDKARADASAFVDALDRAGLLE